MSHNWNGGNPPVGLATYSPVTTWLKFLLPLWTGIGIHILDVKCVTFNCKENSIFYLD
jgi:hypothetical protein